MNDSDQRCIQLDSEQAQLDFAGDVARALSGSFILFLRGDLGTGKTTFARGFIHASGFKGVVKSPTYTLVEPYPVSQGRTCYHFDLYRLGDPEELAYIGARDYFNDNDVCLIEWPQKAEGFLPSADWLCEFEHTSSGRNLNISALSNKGKSLMLLVFSD